MRHTFPRTSEYGVKVHRFQLVTYCPDGALNVPRVLESVLWVYTQPQIVHELKAKYEGNCCALGDICCPTIPVCCGPDTTCCLDACLGSNATCTTCNGGSTFCSADSGQQCCGSTCFITGSNCCANSETGEICPCCNGVCIETSQRCCENGTVCDGPFCCG